MTVLTKEVKIRVVRQNSNRAIYKKKKKRPKGAQEDRYPSRYDQKLFNCKLELNFLTAPHRKQK